MPSRHSDRGRALRAANETAPPSDMYNAVTAALEEKLSPEELYPAALMKFMVSPTAAARNTVAQTLGLLGDIEELNAADFGAPHAIRSTADAPDSSAGMMPSSKEMARMLGGSLDHPSWLPAALLAPGPGEFIAGAKVAAKALVAGMKGVGEFAPGAVSFAQALFHGTPHKFDMFDLKAIGTGEGAQAYGHGLYFAEVKGVAKSYRNALSGPDWPVSVKTDAGEMPLDVVAPPAVVDAMEKFGFPDDAIKNLDSGDWWSGGKFSDAETDEAAKWLRANKDNFEYNKPGHLYEVVIPDPTIEKMLDWDAPLSEQPEALRVIKETIGDDLTFDIDIDYGDIEYTSDFPVERLTGAEAYRQLATRLDSSEAASSALSQAGIPGIRYYDSASRGKGEGTRNIVLFNPEDITSVKRDGELVYEAAKPTTSGSK